MENYPGFPYRAGLVGPINTYSNGSQDADCIAYKINENGELEFIPKNIFKMKKDAKKAKKQLEEALEKNKLTQDEFNMLNDNLNEMLKENGLDEDFSYGKNLSATRLAYNGKGTYKKMTEEEKKEAEELGLIKIRERTGKQIAEASISSVKDIEMADNEDAALKKLVEKTKEGGIKIDEQS